MDFPQINDVALAGRLSGEPVHRALPSGDTLVAWRIVVRRPPRAPRPGVPSRTGVDTIACVSFDRRIQELTADWRRGDLLEVRGSLRRRFWRTKSGALVDRCEVEVREAQIVAVAPAPAREDTAESGRAAGPDGETEPAASATPAEPLEPAEGAEPVEPTAQAGVAEPEG